MSAVTAYDDDGLSTRAGWLRFCATPPPERPEPAAAGHVRRIGRAARDDADLARIRWNTTPVDMPHRAVDDLRGHLEHALTAINAGMPDNHTPRQGLIVTGPGGVGKSTLLRSLAREHHLARAADPPPPAVDGSPHVPVCFVTLDGDTDPKGFAQALLRFYGLPIHPRDTYEQIKPRVKKALRGCRTELVVIDEIGYLRAVDNQGRHAISALRAVQELAPVTVLAAGVDLERSGLLQPSRRVTEHTIQMFRDRNTLWQLDEYNPKKQLDQLAFRDLLVEWERHLTLRRATPGDMSERLWRPLLQRSGGNVLRLAKLLWWASTTAITDGGERITAAGLKRVPDSYVPVPMSGPTLIEAAGSKGRLKGRTKRP